MKLLLGLVVAALISSASATTRIPSSEVTKINTLSFKIRKLVLDFEDKYYSNALAKKAIESTVCGAFYNEIVIFDSSDYTPWFNQSDYQLTVQAEALHSLLSSAYGLAGACNYMTEVELLKFEMYGELWDRDELFYRYVMGE